MRYLLRLVTLILFICNTLNFHLLAEGITPKDSTKEEGKTEKGKFNAGEFIFEHIGDAYYWHILTISGHEKNHEIAIPLPVILYSKNSGLNIHIF